MSNTFDVAVIGGGSAGYAAARTAVAAGLKTVVVDGADELGGLCILRGCMPTKTLLYAAEIMHLARHADTWGLRISNPGFDFPAVMARKDELIRDFAQYRQEQLKDGRFELVRAHGAFEDPHTLRLSNGGLLHAENFIITTGSVVSPPPLSALSEVGYLTSDSALTLKSPPRSLIVLGGGAVALEFAQFFARFGTRVTLIQRSPQVLRDFDGDAAADVRRALEREGVGVFTGTRLTGAERTPSGKRVDFEVGGAPMSAEADEILVALGRLPNTSRLGLREVGVEMKGNRIVTDDTQRTSVNHIYAAGDCAGPHEIVHIAIQQGEIAAHNIAHPSERKAADYRLLIQVVFTDPQAAAVGLTEKVARPAGIPFRAASYPFNDHGKSIIMNVSEGFVKLLAHAGTGEILGGACVGPSGGELIQQIVVGMAKRMTVHELAVVPHYHPTLCEIWTYPAEELAEVIPMH